MHQSNEFARNVMLCCSRSRVIFTFLNYQALQAFLSNFTEIARFTDCLYVLCDQDGLCGSFSLTSFVSAMASLLQAYRKPFISLFPERKINSVQQNISVVQTPHPLRPKETTLIFMFSTLGEILFTNKVFWK